MFAVDAAISKEADRRRTFAIIAHPDAGKTTLTEKLLLYGGQLEVAGMVRGRKSNRAVTSDWMELERQRGISITSTVLTFEYQGHLLNLLDTPGHQDFSEDTYRTLYAADCAVMVLDFAKGIETQTEKLFRICALRGIPILTFVNKVDRHGRDPFDLLDEIETKFGMEGVPFNWPIGSGHEFAGLFDRRKNAAHLYDLERGGDRRLAYRTLSLENVTEQDVAASSLSDLKSSLDLLNGAGTQFDPQLYREGRQTPVFFGSALQNFGIENFLMHFLEISPAPSARRSDLGVVPSSFQEFSGFVFKIQANLDPKHRDRVAFVRVCSGKFERDMEIVHAPSGRRQKVRRCHRVFAAERETMDEAYPGDILGLVNPGHIRLGDTFCAERILHYDPLPQFPPDRFARFRCMDTQRRKQFVAGMEQLSQEGAVQLFTQQPGQLIDPILGAIGELQFDVVKYRLETEYNTRIEMQALPFELARWVSGPDLDLSAIKLDRESAIVFDSFSQPVVLFRSEWSARYYTSENPRLEFRAVSQHSNAFDPRQVPASVSPIRRH